MCNKCVKPVEHQQCPRLSEYAALYCIHIHVVKFISTRLFVRGLIEGLLGNDYSFLRWLLRLFQYYLSLMLYNDLLQLFYIFIILYLTRGSVVIMALYYKPEGRGFDSRWSEFLTYLILPAALGPWVYSASKRNEYRKHINNNVSGE
jgi:hypothetical protein